LPQHPKFFDRVNHDILMGLVAKRVADKRILKLTVNATAPAAAEPMSVSPIESVT
jgi:RNA-directed DNA polymerase